ncbi:MAG: nucleotide disphospho-sugar-binding domain-containing protein, partial [Acidobacteriota bacterium]
AAQLRRLDPQLVLIDGEMHECVIVSAGAGRRTAVLNSFCSIWRRPGLPPPHTLIRPSVGWRGSRLGMALHWSVLRWRKRRRALKQWLQHVGCDRRSRLRALADRHRVDLRAAADAGQWLIPWTYRSLPALSLHAREFDFPHEPPAHVHYFGPMVLRCRNDGSTGDEADADSPRPVDGVQLGDVLKRARTDNRALVYAAFGSTFTASSGIVAQLVAAARDERWSLVLSLGGGDPADLGLLPANVHAFRWLPQLEVLRCADVAIIHGGINTIDECVLSGVPMLVYCGFETDMAGNTARVVYHGLGIAGDPRRDGPLEVRRHLERLLTERRFRDAVARFRPLVERLERDRVAERTVAALLSPER